MPTCERCAHTQEESSYCQRCGGDLHAGSSSKEQTPSSLSPVDWSWGSPQVVARPSDTGTAGGWGDVQWDVPASPAPVRASPPPPPTVRARKRIDHRDDEWTRCCECGCRGMPETRCRNCGIPIRVVSEA